MISVDLDISSIDKIFDVHFETLTLIGGVPFDFVKVAILIVIIPIRFLFGLIKGLDHGVDDWIVFL